MHTRPSYFVKFVGGTLGCAVLVSIFMTSGCFLHASAPNLIPEGYSGITKKEIQGDVAYKAASREVAKLDYPITVAVNPTDKDILINWTKDGESISGEYFWKKVTWWRFALLTLKEEPALCYTEWRTPPSGDVEQFPCTFDVKDHIAKPLIGMLDYSFDQNKPADDARTPGVTRLYYLVLK